jgi:hypothetical protein
MTVLPSFVHPSASPGTRPPEPNPRIVLTVAQILSAYYLTGRCRIATALSGQYSKPPIFSLPVRGGSVTRNSASCCVGGWRLEAGGYKKESPGGASGAHTTDVGAEGDQRYFHLQPPAYPKLRQNLALSSFN